MNQQRIQKMAPDRLTVRKRFWLAWCLFFVGLIITSVITMYVKLEVEVDAKRDFDLACHEIQLRIVDRMKAHAQILRSASALFAASSKVTREEWHTYSTGQKIEQHLPGIQGIGFSLVIPREQLSQHIYEIRSQGFSDYTVKPQGDREIYSSIVYLEPFSGRNLRAFGYDMLSEPVRRKAMEIARDENVAALTGKVTLVQETEREIQAGTLMYVPLYHKGMATDTVAHRRTAHFGWVYSPYRMNDLMGGILQGWDSQVGQRIRLQIFDKEDLSSDSLLYDSRTKTKGGLDKVSGLILLSPIDFHKHPWYLRFTQTDEHLSYGPVYAVFFVGAVISMLAFGLILSLLNTRFKAQELADQLIVDLRESEEKYRIIFNNEIYAICIFDLETLQLIDVNQAYCHLYGYSREELLSGMTTHDITAEAEVSDAATQQAIHEGTIFIPLRYHRKKNGTIFPVEIVGGPYTWQGQKVMFGLAHDITARKAAEAKLLESEKLFRKMFEQNSAVKLITDPHTGNIIQANKAAADFYGWSIEQLMQMRIQEINTLAPEIVESHMEKTRLSGSLRFEFPHRQARGSIRDVEVFTSLIEIQGKQLLYSIIHDINDRKQADNALKNHNWRLNSVIEGTGVGTWEWNIQTGETIFNERWAQMIGYSLDELTPTSIKTWEQLSHPDDLIQCTAMLERHFAGELPYYSSECRMKHKDGRWIWVLDRGRVITFSEDGKPLMMYGTHTDCTESKRLAEEQKKLALQRQQLQKAESLKTMAGAIAHHFNNQLGVVIGNLEMAMDDLSPGPLSETLNEVMKASHRAAEVSGLMLTYLGQSVVQRIPLDLAETCLQGLPLLQAIVPKKKIFTTNLPTPGPIVNANANHILQVLTNLAVNAWEAEDKNKGTVHLTVKLAASSDISAIHRYPVDWHSEDLTYACMALTDSGCGIASEDINKIFDPFFSSKFPGRGLGLAVVLGIIEAHDGVITVESEKGSGSTFRVFLPLSAAQTIPQLDTATQPSAMENGGTVLLVEDEEIVRDMTQSMLTRLGFKVLTAPDGVEAIEVFQKHLNKIDVVMSDLSMPHMDGWETLSALRRIRPDVPVILVSGHDESKVITDDHPELPQVFLHKPYQKAALREALAKAVAKV